MLTSASNENCPISTTTSQCHPNEGRISRRSGNVSAHTVIPANTARKRSSAAAQDDMGGPRSHTGQKALDALLKEASPAAAAQPQCRSWKNRVKVIGHRKDRIGVITSWADRWKVSNCRLHPAGAGTIFHTNPRRPRRRRDQDRAGQGRLDAALEHGQRLGQRRRHFVPDVELEQAVDRARPQESQRKSRCASSEPPMCLPRTSGPG